MNITNHAAERYAERVSEKDKADIPVYVVQNRERIEGWISKLYEHSDYVCSGKIRDNNYSNFNINKDGWVIVTDALRETIVTLYHIDLGVGTEFNKEFISRMKDRLTSDYDNLQALECKMIDRAKELDGLIAGNHEEIKRLKKHIQYLEEANKLLSQEKVVNTMEAETKTKAFHAQLEKFVGSKIQLNK